MATNSDRLVLFGCDLWNRVLFRFFNFLEIHFHFLLGWFQTIMCLVKLKSLRYRAARQTALIHGGFYLTHFLFLVMFFILFNLQYFLLNSFFL